MIICTRCGGHNGDEAPTCAACGRKLQSLRRGGDVERRRTERLTPFGVSARGERFRRLLLRCLEVWAVAVLTLGLAVWGVAGQAWWPVGAAVAVGGAYLALRRG